MNERDQRLSDAREDERNRYYSSQRAQRTMAAYEAEIRLDERRLMGQREQAIEKPTQN